MRGEWGNSFSCRLGRSEEAPGLTPKRTEEIQKFRVVLEDNLTTTVQRSDLLKNLDYYSKQGKKWVVIKA